MAAHVYGVWDGWFRRWKELIIKRDPEELAQAVHEVLKQRLYQPLYVSWWHQFWLHEWLLGQRCDGFTTGDLV